MSNNGGPLSFEATLTDDNFNRALDRMERRQGSFTQNLAAESQKWDGMFKSLAVGIGAVFTFQKAEQFVSQVAKVRGEFQQLEIAFTSMLQSKQKATDLMSQLVRTAATTPFSLTDVAQGAKQLIAYGTGADAVNSTLIRLGNVASGLSVPLNDLVYLYGTLQSQGRAYATDIRQFAGRGIPIYEELAKVLGVSKDKVNDLVEAGKVGFPEIQKVFENLTNKGGMFYNLMEQQSKSLTGQISNLGDAWDQMLNKIGQSSEGTFSEGIQGAQFLIEHYQEIGKILAVLITTYGSYKAALIAVSVAQSIINGSKTAVVYLEMSRALGTLTTGNYANAVAIGVQAKAQAALNAVLLASPYIFIAVAVGTLTAAYVSYRSEAEVVADAQKKVNDLLSENAKIADDLKSKVTELLGVVKDNNSTTFQQVSAFEELQKILPQVYGSLTIQEAKTLTAADAQKKLNQVIDENNSKKLLQDYEDLKSKLQELIKEYAGLNSINDIGEGSPKYLLEQKLILDDLADKIKEQKRLKEEAAAQDRINALPLQDQLNYYRQIESELTIQIDAIKQSQSSTSGVSSAVDILTGKVHGTASAFGGIQNIIDGINLDNLSGRLIEIQKTLASLTGGNNIVKNAPYYEGLQKAAKEKFEQALPGTADFKQAKKDYDAATTALKQWDLTNKKVHVKKEDIVLPSGSVGEYDRLIQKANEALRKTPVDQIQRFKDLQKTILDLTEKRTQAQKVIEVRTWAETLDYKKQQYDIYQNALEAGTKKNANEIDKLVSKKAPTYFQELLEGGQTYLSFLQSQLKPLQDKINAGKGTDDDIAKVLTLNSQIAELSNQNSPFKDYIEELDKMKRDAISTADYLELLNIELDKLNQVPDNLKTNTQLKEKAEIEDRIKAGIIEQGEALKQFLAQVQGSEEKRLNITKKYAALRQEAKKQGNSTTDIEQAEYIELADLAQEANEAWKKLNKTVYDTSTRTGLVKFAADTKAYFESIKDDARFTAKQIEEARLNAKYAKDQLEGFDEKNWLSFASAIGQISGDLAGMEGVVGAIGSLLSGAASQANTFAGNLKLAKSNLDSIKSGGKADTGSTVATAVQGVADLAGMLINSINQKKANKKSRELDAINFQVQMNKALNEEIRLRTILNENVYFKDYAGRIRDSIGAATDALNKYNLALANLDDNGKSLKGTKTTIDWANVGKGALSGAGTGAAIGAAVGVGVLSVPAAAVGAVVGAVVGGVVGLFASKVKNLYGPLLEQYPQLIDANGELNKSLAQTLIDTNQVDDKTKLWLTDLINAADAMEEARKQITDIVSELTDNIGTDLRDVLVNAFESGEDAAYKFSQTVQKTLENALSNLIYSAVFSQAFSKLQKNLEDSLLGSGRSFADVFAEFLGQSQELTDQFNEAMKAAQEEGKKFGFDLFTGGNTDSANNAAQGISRSMTEETGSLIAGQMNALRISQAASLTVLKQHSSQFDIMIHYQSYLVNIDKRLAFMNNQNWRALGFGENPE